MINGLRNTKMDSILFFIIGGLFIVIIVEFFFMQWVIDNVSKENGRLLEELSRSNKALISKNATEYVMTTSIDKVPVDKPQPQAEETVEQDVSSLSDEAFDQFIDKQNGKVKDK